MNQTEPKKMVSRNVAVALGMICVVLIAGLGGAFVYYFLNHVHTNSEYDALENQLNDLQNKVGNFTEILDLGKQETWVDSQDISQSANNFTQLGGGFSPTYAGYISVDVHSSSSTTYTRVIYWLVDHYFDQTNIVGYYGIAYFPVLPHRIVAILVGNTGNATVSPYSETVTVTYYY